MPNQLLPKRWTSQPQYPTGIDWSNPITQGLVMAYTPNSGGSIVNAATGRVFSPTVTAATIGSIGVKGLGMLGTANLTPVISIADASALTAPASGVAATFAYVAYLPLYSGASYTDLFCAGNVRINVNSANSFINRLGVSFSGVADIPTGITRTVNATWSVVHAMNYGGTMDTVATSEQGSFFDSVAVGGVPGVTSKTVDFLGLSGSSGEGCAAGTLLYCVFAWNRRLTVTESLAFNANPWQIFAPSLS